jgi:glycosyltransferase involved in cell wall biosynthesis
MGRDIEYIGEVGLSEKLELLGAATCLLNPIRWDEPFGLVMVEALACGTPVVATARGSVPEIVDHGKTGYCCRGERSLGLALEQIGDLDRARCREAAERRFSAARMVEDYVAMYRRALGPGQMSILDPNEAA